MAVRKSDRAGDSGAEERFAQLFCEAFGEEKGQFVYLQHPFVDIYGNHRTIDFAVMTEDGKVAFEIDGETWHNPGKVSQDKYADDLLKQNSMVYEGWRVFRWTDTQLTKTPDRVKDELITFLGYSPVLTYFDGDTPAQQGSVFELREHQEEALASLVKMREEGKTIALVQGATGSGKSAIGVLDAKQVGKRVLFLAHTKELVEQGAANFEHLWSDVTVGRFYESFHDTDTYVVCGSIQSIIRNLDQFNPYAFERLTQRLLRECGFTEVKVTKKSGDGGIDGTGKLRINGIFSFNVAFQCKRYSGSVGAPDIRDFRGSLTTDIEKGVFITTGTFSKQAREEASNPGKQQIDLIDGDEFINKIAEFGIGVKPITTYEIDEDFFRKI